MSTEGLDNLHEWTDSYSCPNFPAHSVKLALFHYQQRHHKKTIDQYSLWTQTQKSATKYWWTESSITFKRSYTTTNVGFISGMQVQFNLWKSINLIYHIKDKGGKNLHDHFNRCRKKHLREPNNIL